MASPLVIATTLGVAAGGTVVAIQEIERQQRVKEFRRVDRDLRGALATASFPVQQQQQDPRVQDSPPVWVLMVHVGEARLAPRYLRKNFQVVVKYGERSWSLHRETKDVWSTDPGDGKGAWLPFNETCVFLVRRDVMPKLRVRLRRRGRTGWHVLGKSDYLLDSLGVTAFQPFCDEVVMRMTSSGASGTKGAIGSLQFVVEARPFKFADICAHGFNIGVARPTVGLADLADAESPGRHQAPVLQGEPVEASVDVRERRPRQLAREAEERAQRLRDEQPVAARDSEASTSEGESSAGSSTSSQASRGSSSDGESLCHEEPFCPRFLFPCSR